MSGDELMESVRDDVSKLYGDCVVYGPYPRGLDGRAMVEIVTESGARYGKAFAKLLLELKLGRRLSKEETVDHIDENPYNDSIENLQLLSRSENAAKSVNRLRLPEVLCIWCKFEFTPTRFQLEPRAKRKAGPFCSRKCSGQYGAHLQNGGDVLDREIIEREYYKLADKH